jgi:hypothetical protein
LIRK